MINPVFAAPLAKWGVVPDGPETPSSWLLPVRLVSAPAMLKVFKPNSDERDSMDFLKYVDGQGAVRVLTTDDASMLMERAVATRSLVAMVLAGKDIETAEILASTVTKLHANRTQPFPPSLAPLEMRFERLFAMSLLVTQRDVLPLHGDLHHADLLDGWTRGWLAIDNPWPHGEIVHNAGRMNRLATLYAAR